MPTDSSSDRRKKLLAFETSGYAQGYRSIAGIDEAGRGPLAGPVVAAACILPQETIFTISSLEADKRKAADSEECDGGIALAISEERPSIDGLCSRPIPDQVVKIAPQGCWIDQIDDSKKLSPQMRELLFERLTGDPDIAYAVGIVDVAEIDRINIYQATIQAMLLAVDGLPFPPDHLLVDGLALKHPTTTCTKIIQGDQLSLSIAAASIIAKVTRDRLMLRLHEQWPMYGFSQHKGYGTPQHLTALRKHGPCPIHRRSFEPVKTFSQQNGGASPSINQ